MSQWLLNQGVEVQASEMFSHKPACRLLLHTQAVICKFSKARAKHVRVCACVMTKKEFLGMHPLFHPCSLKCFLPNDQRKIAHRYTALEIGPLGVSLVTSCMKLQSWLYQTLHRQGTSPSIKSIEYYTKITIQVDANDCTYLC